jgi:HSP20 family protein
MEIKESIGMISLLISFLEVNMYQMYCGPSRFARHAMQRETEGDTAYQPVPVDVTEKGDEYWIRFSLPGLKAEDIKVNVEGETVSVRGVRSDQDSDGTPMRRERFAGKLGRTLYLPAEVDPDNVEATLEDGVLTLRVKKTEAVRSKTIPVQQK